MSEPMQIDPFDSTLPTITRQCPPLPGWLTRRLLRRDEEVVWVRGPWLRPSWERYVTNPLLFFVCLCAGAACVAIARLGVESWIEVDMAPMLIAAGLIFGSLFLVGFSAGYFTRLVVTSERIVILQGRAITRSWDVDDLPPSLTRYDPRFERNVKRVVALDALQTLLGDSSEQFTDAKSILALGKHLDRIKAREPRPPDTRRTLPDD